METFSRYWPFVRGNHRSPMNFPHKGQWRRALMFSLICVWINGWVNNREAGDLRRHRAIYDTTVMYTAIQLIVNPGHLAQKLCLPVVGTCKRHKKNIQTAHYQPILFLCLYETTGCCTSLLEIAANLHILSIPINLAIKDPQLIVTSQAQNSRKFPHFFISNTSIHNIRAYACQWKVYIDKPYKSSFIAEIVNKLRSVQNCRRFTDIVIKWISLRFTFNWSLSK